MGLITKVSILLTIWTCILQAQAASKYNKDDENRPYEFGFDVVVDNLRHQHRHEEKDERGLIKGEFGFLTADGVYHVTMYATDENGGYRVLSTKNIRVAPLKTAAAPEKKGHSIPFPPSQNAPVTEGPSPAKSCSHCSLPLPPKQPELTDLAIVAKDPAYDDKQYPQNNQQNSPDQQQYSPDQQQNYPSPQQYSPDQQQNYPDQQQHNPEQQQNYNDQQQYSPEQQQNYPDQQQHSPEQQNYPDQQQLNPEHQQNYPDQQQYNPELQQNYPDQQQYSPDPKQNYDGRSGDRNPKQYEGFPPQYTPQDESAPTKPQLISAQMQIVDKDTDIYQKGPGEKDGLPAGLTNKDMELLLYTFNYTVGFHGHHEEGYRNGAKKGYYYVTGRDGVRTRVDYEADEKGFRPKITKEVLDLLSDDVPKPETETEDKYGLKGYEFKWIYYPVDS